MSSVHSFANADATVAVTLHLCDSIGVGGVPCTGTGSSAKRSTIPDRVIHSNKSWPRPGDTAPSPSCLDCSVDAFEPVSTHT